MKTIICVWTLHYHSLYKPPIAIGLGLGDMIRGALGLFELCREKNYKFYLDVQLHPISAFLNVQENPYADLVKSNSTTIKFQDPTKAIEESNEEILLMATNFCPYKVFSNEAKAFLLKLMTPKEWVSSLVDEKIKNLNLSTYNLIHVRCGDNEFLNKQNYWKRFVAMQIIKYNYEKGDLILTDSVKLKSQLRSNENFKLFTDTAVHLAHDFDSESLLNTMLEFYAITRSKKIKTYSRYSHTSGFVYFPAIIYGIPMEKMKMPWHIRTLDIAVNLFEFYAFRLFRNFNRNTVAG